MFGTETVSVSGHEAFMLKGDNGSRAVIIPELGGMVHELVLPLLSDAETDADSGETMSVLRSDSSGELTPNPYYRGRMLLPFCGRIAGGRYRFRGKQYELYVNYPAEGNALHGFLYRTGLQVLSSEAGTDEALLRLHHIIKPQDENGYPFSLQVILTYRLNAQGFTLEFLLANAGLEEVPVTAGWHPYFKLGDCVISNANNNSRVTDGTNQSSSADGSTLACDDVFLTMDADLYYPTHPNLLPTGALISVSGTPNDFRSGRPLCHARLDTCFAFPCFAQLENRKTGKGISICMDKEFFNKLHIYIPPERDSVAIEPVSAAGSAFTMPQLGLMTLQPQQQRSGWIRIQAYKL